MSQTLAALAAQLIAAHDGGPLIDDVPADLVPADRADAEALQDEIVRQIGAVGGWKVLAGRDTPPCSPLPQNRYFDADTALDGARHRLFLAEVEVAVRLSADLAADADRDSVEAAIASLHPALEMIANPFTDRDAMSSDLTLGDLQSNGAIVVGPAFDPAIREALGTLPVALHHDGKLVHAAEEGATWAQTLDALTWLAGHAAGRGLPLKAGQVIITGARALYKLEGARTVDGRFGSWGQIGCTL